MCVRRCETKLCQMRRALLRQGPARKDRDCDALGRATYAAKPRNSWNPAFPGRPQARANVAEKACAQDFCRRIIDGGKTNTRLSGRSSGVENAQSAGPGPCGVQHTFFVIDGIMSTRTRFSRFQTKRLSHEITPITYSHPLGDPTTAKPMTLISSCRPKSLLAAAMLAGYFLNAFAADDFETQCQMRLPPAQVNVSTEPSNVNYDLSQSVRVLSQRHKPPHANSFTLGLTVTKVRFEAQWSLPTLTSESGKTCLRPSVNLFFTVSPQTVFVGNEFPQGTCAFNDISGHENRHVQANQEHIEQVASYYQKAISDAYGQRIFYGRTGGLPNEMQDSFRSRWLPRINADLAKVETLHAQIDSPEEHARSNLMCQGEVPLRLRQMGIAH